MTRYQVRCAWCGKSPDFTDPTNPVCSGCKRWADYCTCSSRTADGDCRICESFGSHADCLGQRNDPLVAIGLVKAVGRGAPAA